VTREPRTIIHSIGREMDSCGYPAADSLETERP
jgi:hypothetical protein